MTEIKTAAMPMKIWLLKWYPVVTNIWLLVLLVAHLYEINLSQYTNMLFGGCLFISLMLYIDSVIYCFCAWHRVLIINQALYLLLQFINRLGIEFNYYLYVALSITIFSLLLATFLYSKHGCFKKMANYKSVKDDN